MQAGDLAWNPSTDPTVPGAGTIGFLRVSPATQATLVQGNMTFTSLDYGAWTNNIQVKLENGTTAGSRKITVYDYTSDTTEVYDNLGTIFDIQYVGAQAYADMSVTVDGTGKATTLTLRTGTSAGTATPVLTYTLGAGQWQDMSKVVADIANNVDFQCTMKPTGHNITTDQLDAVTNQTIKGATYTATAFKGDIMNQIAVSRYISISVATGALPANFAFTNLAGAIDGTAPSSWASLLDSYVYGSGAYIIVPLTADKSIQAEVNNWVTNQSNNERTPMIGIFGGGIGETVDQAVGRAIALNNSRAVLAYPDITVTANDGTIQNLNAYHTASLIAGLVAGADSAKPITFSYVNIVNSGRVLKSADTDRLLTAGVTSIEFSRTPSRTGYRVVQGITTYQLDANPSFREISMRVLSDELSSQLADTLETKFVGGKGTVSTVALIKNEVQSFLDRKVRDQVLVSYDPNSVSVTLTGDTVNVLYSAQPVGALNYILITTKYYQQPITA